MVRRPGNVLFLRCFVADLLATDHTHKESDAGIWVRSIRRLELHIVNAANGRV